MQTTSLVLLVAGLVLFAPGAAAQTETDPSLSAEAAPSRPGDLVLGLEAGGIFPQPFSGLGTHVALGLEAGYRLPMLDHRLEVMLSAGYAPPVRSFREGEYDAEIMVQELTFGIGPRYRFLPVESKWNVTAATGFRLFLLQSRSNGERDGEPFAEFLETSTEPGFFLAVGGELRLGPGAVLLDLDFGLAALDQKISGDASAANLTATLGYRFFLL